MLLVFLTPLDKTRYRGLHAMLLIHLALNLYFAAVLGIAGLSKVEQPSLFAETLERQQVLPSWSIMGISCTLPWCELIIAGALMVDVARPVVGAIVIIFFASFLIVQSALFVMKRQVGCGCYGKAYERLVDGPSLATAVLFLLLAIVHWGLALHVMSAPMPWHVAMVTIYGSIVCWFIGYRQGVTQRAPVAHLK